MDNNQGFFKMVFSRFFMVFYFLIIGSVGVSADMDLPDLEKTLTIMKTTYKVRPGAVLPSKDDFANVESKVGNIPRDLKTFYQECSNLIIRGQDIQQVVGGEKAPLIAFVERAQSDGVDTKTLLPFCPSDEFYICIDRETQEIIIFNPNEELTQIDRYASLAAWLKGEVLPSNSPSCGKI